MSLQCNGNVLIDEKSYQNILVYNIWQKRLTDYKPVLDSIKQMDLLVFMMEQDIQCYLVVKNMIPFDQIPYKYKKWYYI